MIPQFSPLSLPMQKTNLTTGYQRKKLAAINTAVDEFASTDFHFGKRNQFIEKLVQLCDFFVVSSSSVTGRQLGPSDRLGPN